MIATHNSRHWDEAVRRIQESSLTNGRQIYTSNNNDDNKITHVCNELVDNTVTDLKMFSVFCYV
jgi:hypothetical protein